MAKSVAKLGTAQVAERLGVSQAAVKKWCQRGLFAKAELVDTPRGPIWEIPESDVKKFQRPVMGRPAGKKGRAVSNKETG
jgi:predicted site-specific integrase-resolvase